MKHVTPLRGPKRIIRICLFNSCGLSKYSAPTALNPVPWIWDGGHDGPWRGPSEFEIEVQDFVPLPSSSDEHVMDVQLTGRNGDTTMPTPPQYYAISAECLPSLDILEAWVLDTTLHSRRAFFASGFQGTFISLAVRYSECTKYLPLVSLKILSRDSGFMGNWPRSWTVSVSSRPYLMGNLVFLAIYSQCTSFSNAMSQG